MRTVNCFLLTTALLLAATQPARAQLPVSGIYVPERDIFDLTMQQIMSNFDIDAGVLAVSNNGVIVYQRGFGFSTPENTPMRLASVEKPIVSAAIRQLILDGDLNFTDRVFDLGSGLGILPHLPWQGLGDTRLAKITVQDLMNHLGGWDFAVPIGNPPLGSGTGGQAGDPQFLTAEIAIQMGNVPIPANRENIIRFMLSQPLQFDPGTIPTGGQCTNPSGNPAYCYSNFGHMVLGRIVEEVSGMGLVDFYHSRVITPDMWVPNQEIIYGRSLSQHQHPLEPFYNCGGCMCQNVFDPFGPMVPCPCGGFQLEAFQGHGNLVTSAVPLLRYMENYVVGVQAGAGAPWSLGIGGNFTGAFDGTNTSIIQRGDGINIVVLFSRRDSNAAASAAQLISAIITNSNPVFPTFDVDGYWIDFTAPPVPFEVGGFNHPFRNMSQALDVGAGAKLRFKPGSTSWTGTISHKVVMDSPFGTATIGN